MSIKDRALAAGKVKRVPAQKAEPRLPPVQPEPRAAETIAAAPIDTATPPAAQRQETSPALKPETTVVTATPPELLESTRPKPAVPPSTDVTVRKSVWQCGGCGSAMGEDYSNCIRCGTEKPKEEPAAIPGPKPAISPSTDVTVRKSTWQCGGCGSAMNEDYSNCRFCGAEKPKEEPATIPGPEPATRVPEISLNHTRDAEFPVALVLEQLGLDGNPVRTMTLQKERSIIGREGDTIQINYELSVSRYHAAIKMEDDGRVRISSLGDSVTFVNGEPVSRDTRKYADLKEGDNIRMGEVSLRVREIWKPTDPEPVYGPVQQPEPPAPQPAPQVLLNGEQPRHTEIDVNGERVPLVTNLSDDEIARLREPVQPESRATVQGFGSASAGATEIPKATEVIVNRELDDQKLEAKLVLARSDQGSTATQIAANLDSATRITIGGNSACDIEIRNDPSVTQASAIISLVNGRIAATATANDVVSVDGMPQYAGQSSELTSGGCLKIGGTVLDVKEMTHPRVQEPEPTIASTRTLVDPAFRMSLTLEQIRSDGSVACELLVQRPWIRIGAGTDCDIRMSGIPSDAFLELTLDAGSGMVANRHVYTGREATGNLTADGATFMFGRMGFRVKGIKAEPEQPAPAPKEPVQQPPKSDVYNIVTRDLVDPSFGFSITLRPIGLGGELGDAIAVQCAKATVGREKSQNIFIQDDPKVSHRHAILTLDAARYSAYISDGGSSNGTRVNDARINPGNPAKLGDGDRLMVGVTSFRVTVPPKPATAAPQPVSRPAAQQPGGAAPDGGATKVERPPAAPSIVPSARPSISQPVTTATGRSIRESEWYRGEPQGQEVNVADEPFFADDEPQDYSPSPRRTMHLPPAEKPSNAGSRDLIDLPAPRQVVSRHGVRITGHGERTAKGETGMLYTVAFRKGKVQDVLIQNGGEETVADERTGTRVTLYYEHEKNGTKARIVRPKLSRRAFIAVGRAANRTGDALGHARDFVKENSEEATEAVVHAAVTAGVAGSGALGAVTQSPGGQVAILAAYLASALAWLGYDIYRKNK